MRIFRKLAHLIKKDEVEKEISEEENLIIDLQEAIKILEEFDTFIKKGKIPGHTVSSIFYGSPAFVDEYMNNFRNAINWLKEAKKRIYLIENITKKRIKENPKTYRKSFSSEEKAAKVMEEAEPLLEEIIEFLIAKREDVHGWFNDVNDFKKRFKGFEDKISYLKSLEESIILLIDLERKAKEQS